MAELIDLTELKAALEEYAADVAEMYKANLKGSEHIASSALINSVQTHVVEGDSVFEVTMDVAKYWKYVEEGLRGSENPSSPYNNPGWKAYPFILKWIDIKPVIPRPDNNGPIPSEKSLAYLITRKIVDAGTKGSHDLEDAKRVTMEQHRERISAALGHDCENYIRKVLL